MIEPDADLAKKDYQILRMLSFNIQVGIDTARYSDYIRHSWRHFLPHARRHLNLAKIAEVVSHYDIVALQEVDAGSLRSSYVNQVKFIADHAGFPHWHVQTNRNLARIAAHSNGLLAKIPAELIIDHSLPGMIPGRGALQVGFGRGKNSFIVMVVHLALGKKARAKQIAYIAEQLAETRYFAIMGDMNCEPIQVALELEKIGLDAKLAPIPKPTYPSWNPRKMLDQIVVSHAIEIQQMSVLPYPISDHLPVAMNIRLPKELARAIQLRDCIKQSSTC